MPSVRLMIPVSQSKNRRCLPDKAENKKPAAEVRRSCRKPISRKSVERALVSRQLKDRHRLLSAVGEYLQQDALVAILNNSDLDGLFWHLENTSLNGYGSRRIPRGM